MIGVVGLGYWAGDEGARVIAALHGHVRLGVAIVATVTAAVFVVRWYRGPR